MREFGWTIEYTLSLSWPVFFSLFGLIRRIRIDSAIDEFHAPYLAAKFGGKFSDKFFNGRGSFFLSEGANGTPSPKDYSKAALKRANQKLQMIIESRNKALAMAAGTS